MRDAIVIGGGVVGASTAYHLARRGIETLLVDRADEGRATDAGAGILSAPTSSRASSEPWFEFAVEAVSYYPELIDALAADGDGETGYTRCGLLSVAVADDEVEPLERAERRIRNRQQRRRRPAPDAVETVTPERARELFPPLALVERALYYEEGARVDGRQLTRALVTAGEANGLAVERGDAEEIVVEDGAVTAVVVDGERRPTRNAVVAGGAWSAAFGDQLGTRLPIRPQRGQIAHLDLQDRFDETADWPVVSAFRGHYVVPWPGGRVAAGATRESDAGFDPRTTAAGVHEVLDEALRVAPGVADARLAEVRVGLRPVSEDHLPVVGALPDVDGGYVATGHGPTGLQLGPYSGRVVATLVDGEQPGVDLSAFSPDRFG